MDQRKTILTVLAMISLVVVVYFNTIILSAEWFGVLIGMGIIAFLIFRTKKIDKNDVFLIILIVFIISFANSFYFGPSSSIAGSYGTVLSPNWWDALNWIKENTAECAVVATYWDPGHFITGIGDRAVVFDGASQGAYFIRNTTEEEGLRIENFDSGINHIVMVQNGEKTTARIQDISTTLLTANETLAVEILKEYMKPGCDEMYYIASADLIGKSVWWSYFSTWDPVDKGTRYSYSMLRLSQAKPLPEQNSIEYIYPIDQQTSFLIYDTNGTLQPLLQQGNQFVSVEKFTYFLGNGTATLITNPEAEVKGTLWLTPDRGTLIFMPPELENAMFTRLFFFDGRGLEHFEPVQNWGGEVKLYRVRFD